MSISFLLYAHRDQMSTNQLTNSKCFMVSPFPWTVTCTCAEPRGRTWIIHRMVLGEKAELTWIFQSAALRRWSGTIELTEQPEQRGTPSGRRRNLLWKHIVIITCFIKRSKIYIIYTKQSYVVYVYKTTVISQNTKNILNVLYHTRCRENGRKW